MASENNFVTSCSSDKENCTTRAKEQKKTSKLSHSRSWASIRNPLSSLSENVPLLHNLVKRKETFHESTKPSVKKKEDKSSITRLEKNCQLLEKKVTLRSGEVEKEVFVSADEHYLGHSSNGNIKENRQLLEKNVTLRNGEVENEVFVSGDEHYLSYLSNDKSQKLFLKEIQHGQKSEVAPAVPLVRSSVKKPARKLTLVRKLSSRHSRSKTENFYADCLYNEEYFEDNCKYMLRREGRFVFRKSYLTKNSNFSYRLVIINWLIYLHQALDLSEATLFITVRMFDHLLTKGKVPADNYGLMAIACIWIANKAHDSHYILAPKLYALGSGKYSRNQIITKERDILTSLDFNLNYPEPSTFLFYYLKKENLENDLKIRYSAMFMLEMFTFILEFSSSPPSILAASALYLVFLKFDISCENFLNHVKSQIIDQNTFQNFSNHISLCVKELLNCKSFDNEVVAKYSVPERCDVARIFVAN